MSLFDPHQAGGLHRCRKTAAIAEAANILVTLHSRSEPGFSTAAYLHLAAALPNLMLAVDNQQLNLTGDIVDEPHRIERDNLRVPNGAGLGRQLSQQKLEPYRAEQIGQPYVDRPDWFPTKPQY